MNYFFCFFWLSVSWRFGHSKLQSIEKFSVLSKVFFSEILSEALKRSTLIWKANIWTFVANSVQEIYQIPRWKTFWINRILEISWFFKRTKRMILKIHTFSCISKTIFQYWYNKIIQDISYWKWSNHIVHFKSHFMHFLTNFDHSKHYADYCWCFLSNKRAFNIFARE